MVPRRRQVSPARSWMAGLLLVGLPPGIAAETGSDPAAALERAISAAEGSLQKGDFPGAESHYREALLEGWLLMGTLERLEGRLPEARAALRSASTFAAEDRQALQSLAVAHLEMGETSQAVEILTGLAGKDPRDFESHRRLVRALAAAGQLERAVQKLDEARAAAPDDPELLFLLATEYLWLRKVDAAELLFARTVKARPMPQTHVLIGRSYREAGEYGRARAELEAALSQDPSVRRAHYYLGMVILADARTGPDRLERAIAEFREELKLEPRDALANDQLGAALLEADRPAEALPAFEAACVEAHSLYVYDLGRCQLALDRPAEAAASLRRALDLAREQGAGDAERQRIHYQLGLALRKLGQTQEAVTQLLEARRLAAAEAGASSVPVTAVDPSDAAAAPRADGASGARTEASALAALSRSQRLELKGRVSAGLARAYLNLGVMQAQGQRFSRAAELFEKAAELDPDLPQVQSSLGVAYFNGRQYDKATGPLSRALAARPQDSDLKRMLAMAWLESQSYDRAVELLRDDPELRVNPSLQFAYGLALVKSERAAEAEGVFSRLLAEHGDSAELSVVLGQAHAQQGDFDSAIESLQRALQLKPDVAEANATLGVIYLKQGRLAEAQQALRAELKRQPGDVKSRQNLAMVLDLEQRPAEAIDLLRGVVNSKPDFVDARYLLGKILLAQGAAAEALAQLEAAAQLAPEDASIHYQLGRTYQSLGRKEQAQQEFEIFRHLKDKRRGSAR